MKKRVSLLLGFTAMAVIVGSLVWERVAGYSSAQSEKPSIGVAVEYNARNEFSLTQGGTSGVWNYGYSTSDTNNTFTPYAGTRTVVQCGVNFEEWNITPPDAPVIARNAGAVSCIGIPPEALFLHPSQSGQRSVLRWTAPAAGTYLLNGVFGRQNANATTDLKILKNVSEPALYTASIVAVSQQAFNFAVTVAMGDTLDFSVGWGNGTYNNDGSTLALTIGQPVTACATKPANQNVWLAGENSPSDVESVNTNATLVGDANYTNLGKVGRAFTFDGAGDYVRVEDSPGQKPINQLTAEGWFKINSLTGLPHLISKPLRNSVYNSYAIFWYNGGINIGYYQTNQAFNLYNTGFVPQTGVWYHYAFVLNTDDAGPTANTQKLFVNGVEVFSGVAGLPIFNNGINDALAPYPLLVGADLENNVSSFFLDGQADEVSIYDRALTQPELFNIVKQGSFGKCAPPRCAEAPKGMVSWFQGETNTLDSRSNNHGTLQNGATFAAVRVGQGFSFDGVDDKVAVPNSPDLNITGNQLTIEAWINPTNVLGDRQVVSMASSTAQPAGRKFGLYIQNGSVGFEVNTTNGYGGPPPSGAVSPGVLTHIAGVYNGSQMTWYINGNIAGTFPLTGNIVPSAGDFSIGQFATNGASTFHGLIDEVGVYNRSLSQTEILAIVIAGQSGKCKPSPLSTTANQIAWFTGDGYAADISGNSNNGVFVGGSSYAVGKVGQDLNFTGAQTVQAPDSATLDLTNAFTIETWVSPTVEGLGSQQTFFVSKGNMNFGNTQSYGVLFYQDRRIGNRVGNGSTFDTLNSTAQIPLNTFTHIATTYDGATLRIYINGVLNSSQATAIGTLLNSSQPLVVGGGDFGGSTINVQSAIDEVSLYNRALTSSELAAIYNAGVAGKSKSAATSVNFARNGRGTTAPSFAPTSVHLDDVDVVYQQVTTAGITSKSGIDLSLSPALPLPTTFTGLAYDVSTTAVFTTATVCFNLPSINDPDQFARLRVLHLESGNWMSRTDLVNSDFGTRTLCSSSLTSLSPFVIVELLAPSAANVSVGGRVTTADGRGITNAVMSLTDAAGITRMARTGPFGYYRFEDLTGGADYILMVQSKRYSFSEPIRIVRAADGATDVNFVAVE